MDKIHELYQRAIEADRAYRDALHEEFGSDAVEVRYSTDKSYWPQYLKDLRAAKIRADNARHEEISKDWVYK